MGFPDRIGELEKGSVLESELENYVLENFRSLGYVSLAKINTPTGYGGDFVGKLPDGKEVLVELEVHTEAFVRHGHDPNKIDELIVFQHDENFTKENRDKLPKVIKVIPIQHFWSWRIRCYNIEYEARKAELELEELRKEVELRKIDPIKVYNETYAKLISELCNYVIKLNNPTATAVIVGQILSDISFYPRNLKEYFYVQTINWLNVLLASKMLESEETIKEAEEAIKLAKGWVELWEWREKKYGELENAVEELMNIAEGAVKTKSEQQEKIHIQKKIIETLFEFLEGIPWEKLNPKFNPRKIPRGMMLIEIRKWKEAVMKAVITEEQKKESGNKRLTDFGVSVHV